MQVLLNFLSGIFSSLNDQSLVDSTLCSGCLENLPLNQKCQVMDQEINWVPIRANGIYYQN